MLPKNLNDLTVAELHKRVNTLESAIADSRDRQRSYLPHDPYYLQQRDKQDEWYSEIWAITKRINLLTNDKPITGVIAINNTNIGLTEELFDCINLTSEEAFDEHKSQCDNTQCAEMDDHQWFWDSWEEDASDTRLIGEWVKDIKTGEYRPDKDGDYAAIVGESNIQVVWSKTTIRVKQMCSPCYPGQADLDSGESPEGILAYTLPKELTEDL